MPSFYDIPESILHDILSTVIDATKSKGWQLSLRLVNRDFNEAILYVYFVHKSVDTTLRGCSDDCIGPCYGSYCRDKIYLGSKERYAARFNVQGFLARQGTPLNSNAAQYSQQWNTALTILRRRDDLQWLNLTRSQSCPVLSNNPTFKDTSSAVLAEAVCSIFGSYFGFITDPSQIPSLPPYYALSAEFWIALSACLVGDLSLLETVVNSLQQPPEEASSPGLPEWLNARQPTFLLVAAIDHAQFHIIDYLFRMFPDLPLSGSFARASPLKAAIFSDNELVLKTILKRKDCSPSLVSGALYGDYLLNRHPRGSKIIRLLMKQFSPLSIQLREQLIQQSCAIGDVTLLEDLSLTEPLFSNYEVRERSCLGHPWSWIDFAIRFGHIDALRFLLDRAAVVPDFRRELRHATQRALIFNQIECYEELYQRYELVGCDNDYHAALAEPRSVMYFCQLAMAEGAVGMMQTFISQHGGMIAGPSDDEHTKPLSYLAPHALTWALARLRPDNLHFLLKKGVRLPQDLSKSRDPFAIHWPYFNLNRDAFIRTQEVLEEFGMPQLRIVV